MHVVCYISDQDANASQSQSQSQGLLDFGDSDDDEDDKTEEKKKEGGDNDESSSDDDLPLTNAAKRKVPGTSFMWFHRGWGGGTQNSFLWGKWTHILAL